MKGGDTAGRRPCPEREDNSHALQMLTPETPAATRIPKSRAQSEEP